MHAVIRVAGCALTVQDNASQQSVMPKIVVFGGRGFVGSHICQEALSTGLHVVSISRSGTPPLSKEPWTQQVWLSIFIEELQVSAFQHILNL